MSKLEQQMLLGLVLSVTACIPQSDGDDGSSETTSLGTLSQRIESMNGPQLVGTTLPEGQLLTIADSPLISHSKTALVCPSGSCVGTEFIGQIESKSYKLKIMATATYSSLTYYQLSYSNMAPIAWVPVCPSMSPWAIIIPGSWNNAATHVTSNPAVFSIACMDSAAYTCAVYGLLDPLSDVYQACTRMIRADFCGDGMAHTRHGPSVDFIKSGGSYENKAGEDGWEFEAAWGTRGVICAKSSSEVGTVGCPIEYRATCASEPFSGTLLLKNLFLKRFCPLGGDARCDHCPPYAGVARPDCFPRPDVPHDGSVLRSVSARP